MPFAVIAAAALLAAGGSLEARSGAVRLERADGRLVLHAGIRAACDRGTCDWRLTAEVRGRRVGSARGTVRAGPPVALRMRLGPRGTAAFPRGRRVKVVLDATLTPPEGEAIGLARSAYVRAPR